jgi:predicted amidohydrolase YtcJ
MPADTLLRNAKIATNSIPSFVDALAITDGKITATGNDRDLFRLRGPATKVIDANRRTVIPGLNDSQMHPIRAGLSYNMELRWDGDSVYGWAYNWRGQLFYTADGGEHWKKIETLVIVDRIARVEARRVSVRFHVSKADARC